jgi:peroxidase
MAGSRALVVVAAAVLVIAASCAAAERYPPLASGLCFDFYKNSCPQAEWIVEDSLRSAARQNPGLIPALIRIHFHDCFIQGCDGSVLLDNSTGGVVSEKTYPPNRTLRPAAFKAINDIGQRLEQACGRVVSCADIVALTARDSVKLVNCCWVFLLPRPAGDSHQFQASSRNEAIYVCMMQAGGPSYKVPLGRRDGLSPASESVVNNGLPAPSSTVPELMAVLSKIDLDLTDLVAISGGHTVGIAHCSSFEDRLFPARDPTMNEWFFNHLKQTCPAKGVDNITVNDIRTPRTFDNKYYVDLMNRQGLFTSDQDLFVNATSKPIVTKFAIDQNAFFDQFVYSYVKMGMISVLTGSQGQVRANCAFRNPTSSSLPWSVVDAVENLVL